MDISIGKLQQLVAVAKCGSFSRAADELSMSQPALSRSVAAMEERYGFPFFNRVGHGVELTSAGAQVIEQARPLLQELRIFDSNVRLIGLGKAGSLSLGMAPLLASQLLAQFAAEFYEPGSEAQLRVTIRPGEKLLKAVKADEIELFFYPQGHLEPNPELEVERVGVVNAACYVRAGHPLLARSTISKRDLADYPWASSVGSHLAPELSNPARFICDNYHILREAVLTSDLVFICSREFVAPQLRDGTIRMIEVSDLPLGEITIYAAKLRGRVNSPLAVAAVASVRRLLQSLG